MISLYIFRGFLSRRGQCPAAVQERRGPRAGGHRPSVPRPRRAELRCRGELRRRVASAA